MAHWLHRIVLALLLPSLQCMAVFMAVQSLVWAEGPVVIEPELDRKPTKVSRIDNENIEIGLYGGILAIEDFDTSGIATLRANFHINEALFLEASYHVAKGDLTSFEEIITTSQVITDDERDYTGYDLSLGWNALRGEVWILGKAFKSDLYLTIGIGRTEFGGDKWITVNPGAGYRVALTDWLSWRIDVRDHIFNRDIFGEDDTTNNIEISSGFSFFF